MTTLDVSTLRAPWLGMHGAPHVPIDRRVLGVDVVLCSPYKFFGPHAGVMAADPELLARLSPDRVRPGPDTGPERWQTGTARFEAFAGSAAAAARLMDDVGMRAVRAHEQTLSRAFLTGLADRLDWRLHGPATAADRVLAALDAVD